MNDQKDNSQGTQENKGQSAPADWAYLSKKTEKLTTALYMVTDMMPSEEPMKWKAREFGVGLLSDVMLCGSASMSERAELLKRVMKGVDHVVSYLEVAWTTRMMSEMNATILKKEYMTLKDTITSEWERAARSGAVLAPSFFDVPRQLPAEPKREPPEVNTSGLYAEVSPRESSRVSASEQHSQASGGRDVSVTAPVRESSTPQAAPTPRTAPQGQPTTELRRIEVKDTPASARLATPAQPPQGQASAAPLRTTDSQLRTDSAPVLQGRSYLMKGESTDGGRTFTFRKHDERNPILHTPTPNSSGETKRELPEVQSTGTAAPRESSRNQTVRPDSIVRDDRRKIILALVKQKPSLTVKDIAKSISGYSEKTIQRELLAMVAEGILTKKGERRWSTYSLGSQ